MKKAPHKLMRNIAKNMVARRQHLGMRQADLARQAGVSEAIISLIERQERDDIMLETLHNIALGLKCDVAQLLYG